MRLFLDNITAQWMKGLPEGPAPAHAQEAQGKEGAPGQKGQSALGATRPSDAPACNIMCSVI